jgi:hypothetical protein
LIRAFTAFALLLATTASAKTDTQTASAFRAAFGSSGSAILKRQGDYQETIKYTPGALVETPFGPVLISPGEVLNAGHVNSGKLAAIYLKRSPRGFAVTKRFLRAAETGSFGTIGKWRVSRTFGRLPVVVVEGGGTWQGCTVHNGTLLELAPEGPRELVTVPLYNYYAPDFGRGRPINLRGKIIGIVANRSFEIAYSGSSRFTERYVRRGDKYVLAGGGESRVAGC